jgi:hypothetical protein
VYEALDAFLNVQTWHSGHPLDRERFYRALRPIVSRQDFSADRMREYMYEKFHLGVLPENHPFHKAVDHYASAADAIHGYLLTPE